MQASSRLHGTGPAKLILLMSLVIRQILGTCLTSFGVIAQFNCPSTLCGSHGDRAFLITGPATSVSALCGSFFFFYLTSLLRCQLTTLKSRPSQDNAFISLFPYFVSLNVKCLCAAHGISKTGIVFHVEVCKYGSG